MAAAGFMFLASKMSKEKKQEEFLGRANIGKKKKKILTQSLFGAPLLCCQIYVRSTI